MWVWSRQSNCEDRSRLACSGVESESECLLRTLLGGGMVCRSSRLGWGQRSTAACVPGIASGQ